MSKMVISAFRTFLLVLASAIVSTRRTPPLFEAQAAANYVHQHAENEDDKDVDGRVRKKARQYGPKRKYDPIGR
jgi:hypothetical protein